MLVTCGACKSQNIVPNGDFELYTSCPTYYNQLDSALFWHNPTPGSPDYFNSCASSFVGVPYNNGGYQPAHSGNAYSGLILFHPFLSAREYIEVTLSTSLIQGQLYFFEMYVCMGDIHRYSTDDFGVYFSDTIINNGTGVLFSLTPQITNTDGFYPDTVNWSSVSGYYTAHGGEQFLVIGNFKDNASSTYIQINNVTPNYYAYLLVDDVSLTPVTGVKSLDEEKLIVTQPNPFKNNLKITMNEIGSYELGLFDITNRQIFNHSFVNTITINTEQFAEGIYMYEIRNKNGVIKQGKVVKK